MIRKIAYKLKLIVCAVLLKYLLFKNALYLDSLNVYFEIITIVEDDKLLFFNIKTRN